MLSKHVLIILSVPETMKIIYTGLILCQILCHGCSRMQQNNEKAVHNGTTAVKMFAVEPFAAITSTGCINVVMSSQKGDSVRVETLDKVMPLVHVLSKDGWLCLSMDAAKDLKDVSVNVTVPYVENMQRLSIFGACTFTAEAPVNGQTLRICVTGASTASIANAGVREVDAKVSGASILELGNVTSDNFRANVSGASYLSAAGVSESCNILVSGASKADLKNVETQKSDVQISGASKAEITAMESVAGNVSGASKLITFGKAAHSVSSSGASKIRKNAYWTNR